LLPFQLPARI
jgi:hypothetical protein